jgi:hypothetical protein
VSFPSSILRASEEAMGSHEKSDEELASVLDEFAGADLGDARREQRLLKVVDAFARAPEKSLPRMSRDEAELEAFYRFFGNEAFSYEDLMLPHRCATASRVAEERTALVAHDSTKFSFALDDFVREGLDAFGKTQGFWGAFSLAVTADGLRPLGTLGGTTWTRSELPPRKSPNQKRRTPRVREGHDCGRIEGARWLEFIDRSEQYVDDRQRLIHVIDCEADSYVLFSTLVASKRRFVIRMSGNRNVFVEEHAREFAKASEVARRTSSVREVSVPISKRTKLRAKRSRLPARDRRIAHLSFGAVPITLKRNSGIEPTHPKTLTLNLVCVVEHNPPAGQEPIEWLLLTAEPIDTEESIANVVGYYKARWRIEEFFRALKSGCAFEERQLESREALLKVLAISLVVAWRVMLLRSVSRLDPDAPASTVLSPLQLTVLKATGRVQLPAAPTVAEALRAVAALGGHIKNNGAPGLITLSRGMERLLERVVGCVLMMQSVGELQKK